MRGNKMTSRSRRARDNDYNSRKVKAFKSLGYKISRIAKIMGMEYKYIKRLYMQLED